MPKGCSLFSLEVMHRDFFKCNPANTGHYEYPRFETLSYDEGCHCKEVNALLKRDDSEKYVIFYTRNTDLFRHSKNKVIGFFKVGQCFKAPKKGFFASEKVLLPKNESIDINYSSRGVPVSWGNSSVKDDVDKILTTLRTNIGIDISTKYQDETRRIMEYLKSPSGRKQIVDICESCNVKRECYWGKQSKQFNQMKLNELYAEAIIHVK